LYRTGDLARRLQDATIEFLGRIDHQVKIRGFRIELGEIETAITLHDGIENCAVVAQPGENGDDMLVAYFTYSGRTLNTQDLRNNLRNRLPDYMLPQAYISMDALPLTPNGKLDRAALPPPEVMLQTIPAGGSPPESAVEQRIGKTWQKILGLDRVSREDSFFDLGGHSLLMLRVFEKLREDYPNLALVDLFHYPTVEALAEFLSAEIPVPPKQEEGHQGLKRREALGRLRERRNQSRTSW
jgi:hypothetical protein